MIAGMVTLRCICSALIRHRGVWGGYSMLAEVLHAGENAPYSSRMVVAGEAVDYGLSPHRIFIAESEQHKFG